MAEISPYGSVKCIRSDQGTEFTSNAFEFLLVKHSIKREMSAPYSPHQNGTIERAWRSVFDMARCMLLESKLPKCLWPYAVMTAAYIRNRCYNPRVDKTAFEAFTNEKPNVKNMHIFGSICCAYVQKKRKLDARCQQGIFVGYGFGHFILFVYFFPWLRKDSKRCLFVLDLVILFYLFIFFLGRERTVSLRCLFVLDLVILFYLFIFFLGRKRTV